MLEFVRQFLAGLVLAWERLSASARVTVATAFLFTAAAIALVVYMGSQPQYVELFSNLSPQDMVAVEGRLDQENVPWKADATGKVIMVPLQYRSDMRVKINGAGLVKSQGVLPGFEIFDTANLMQNQFTQNINYQRALSGELQRLLNEYSFVKNSFVSIREAQDEVFTNDQKPTEATVTLDVDGSLTEEQTKAVLNTVASFGGAKLTRDHINLATVDGKILHAPAENDFDSIASSKFELARAYRNELKRDAETALKQLGVRSVVTLTLDVDQSSKKQKTEEKRKGADVSTYTTTNTTQSSESAPQGPAGASANLPADAQNAAGQSTRQSEEQTITNTEPSTTTTETISPPGTVKVSRVMAIVEGRYEDEMDPQGKPTGKKTYVPRKKEELQAYKDSVAAAVGVTDDQIKVTDHPFELEQLAAATPAAATTKSSFPLGMVQLDSIFKLVAVIILFFAVRFFALRATVRREDKEEHQAIAIPTASPEEMRKREIASEVERVSQEQPETVASLIRTWLSEPEE